MSATKLSALRQPKAALRAGLVYSGDNGRRLCAHIHCAGASAFYSGRDLSGRKVTPFSQADADEWLEIMGVTLDCECGRTKHLPSAGVQYNERKARAVFTSEPYLEAASVATAIES